MNKLIHYPSECNETVDALLERLLGKLPSRKYSKSGPYPTVPYTDILAYRQDHPEASLAIIGEHFGLTRERIRQVLFKWGLPTVHQTVPKPFIECKYCHVPFRPKSKQVVYCSTECRKAAGLITLVCTVCGKDFQRLRSQHLRSRTDPAYKTGRVYCSKHCFGVYCGTHHGAGINPKVQEWIRQRRENPYCKQGHPRTPENTYTRINKKGKTQKQCRLCSKAKYRAKYVKKPPRPEPAACKRGHKWPENVYLYTYQGRTYRQCRACNTMLAKARYQRQKAARIAT